MSDPIEEGKDKDKETIVVGDGNDEGGGGPRTSATVITITHVRVKKDATEEDSSSYEEAETPFTTTGPPAPTKTQSRGGMSLLRQEIVILVTACLLLALCLLLVMYNGVYLWWSSVRSKDAERHLKVCSSKSDQLECIFPQKAFPLEAGALGVLSLLTLLAIINFTVKMVLYYRKKLKKYRKTNAVLLLTLCLLSITAGTLMIVAVERLDTAFFFDQDGKKVGTPSITVQEERRASYLYHAKMVGGWSIIVCGGLGFLMEMLITLFPPSPEEMEMEMTEHEKAHLASHRIKELETNKAHDHDPHRRQPGFMKTKTQKSRLGSLYELIPYSQRLKYN